MAAEFYGTHTMRKINIKIAILMLLMLVFLAACKPQQDLFPSIDQQLSDIKSTTADAISGTLSNESIILPSQQQVVFVPSQEGIITQSYLSPCVLAKYKGLNVYCKFKNFWHNQSALFSWYIPYSIVLFFALLLAIIILYWLWRRH